MERNAIMVNPRDNVAVVIAEVKAGGKITGLAGQDLTARADIPRNHKVAVVKIPRDAPVIKYGEAIGRAAVEIEAGEWVHTHNLKAEQG